MAKRGYLIGMVGYLLFMAIAFLLYYLASLLPQFQVPLLLFAIFAIMIAGFFVIWSITLEGNAWITRNLGRKPVHLDIIALPSGFATMLQVVSSNLTFNHDNVDYLIDKDRFFYPRGVGVPYMLHLHNRPDPIDINKLERNVDAVTLTTYTQNRIDLAIAINENEERNKLFILIGVAAALSLITIVYLYFFGLPDVTKACSATFTECGNALAKASVQAGQITR